MWAYAGRLTAEMDPESESLRRVVAENDFGFESRQLSSVSGMNGVRMEVKFAGKPARPATGVASGRIHVQQQVLNGASAPAAAGVSPGKFPASRRALMTEEIQFSFRDSGRTLKDAATTSNARLVMVPSDPRAGQRDVTARRLLMSFDALGRLETMRGEGGTNIWFAPGKNAPAGSAGQNSASDRLVAILDPATETVQRVEQTGNYRFFDGDRQAAADRASYETSTERLTLTGKPRVWDPEMRARAGKILFDLASGRAEGLGKVESTHTGSASRGEPTSVLADRVVAERRSQTVRYEGHVRAWRGSDVVESDALDILRAERRVSSGAQVLTSHLQPATAVGDPTSKGSPAASRPATIRADHLEYSEQGRKATYSGDVKMQTERTTLEADRLDAYFKESGNATELERAIADGNVKVTQPGRRATGRHAEYFSSDGKIILTGGPPALYDAEKGFTSGQSLTFYSHDDRLVVSGGEESTTISRHRIGQ
jgi:lipopolysaccharide export system protein LptA